MSENVTTLTSLFDAIGITDNNYECRNEDCDYSTTKQDLKPDSNDYKTHSKYSDFICPQCETKQQIIWCKSCNRGYNCRAEIPWQRNDRYGKRKCRCKCGYLLEVKQDQ